MEHRLIQGGEQFLPFARSCVAKLKKLGLPYADQSHEVEGVSIKVRIEPGHEYIRIEGGGHAYLESGQLEWTFPSEINPDKYAPAKWRFLDIPVDATHLGWANARYGSRLGEQKKNQVLSEGMASQAIGYPAKQESSEAQLADLEDAYADSTMMKKIVAGLFKPSLFSGKLRLFMQAQYGALADMKHLPFSVEGSGASVALIYTDEKGNRLQFGLWAHASPGIFTADDGSYWLVNFRAVQAGSFSITAYPIRISGENKGFKRRLKDPGISDLEQAQCEGYLFSGASIQLDKGQLLGTVPDDGGWAISYGWKFSRSGKNVSIVLIKEFDTGGLDQYWTARTIHCKLGSTTSEAAGEVSISFSYTQENHGNWNYDTYAEYNVFTPESELSNGPLYAISRNDPSKMRTAFDFVSVSIYGYYVGESWTPVKISRRTNPGPWPKFRNAFSGYWASTSSQETLATQGNADQFVSTVSNIPFAYEQHSITQGREMDLAVGGRTFAGASEYGTHVYRTRVMVGGVTEPNSVPYPGAFTEGGYPGVDAPGGTITGNSSGGTHYVTKGTTTLDQYIFTGWAFRLWALVIPGQECEAVYVARYRDEGNTTDHLQTVGTGVINFSGNTVDMTYGYSPGMNYSYSPWCGATQVGGWYGVPTNFTQTNDTETRPPYAYEVDCFSVNVPGVSGTPGGSYYTLFNVDISNPYYNGIMYFLNSYGGRYAASEHQTIPASVNYQLPFVGWA